jgi:hypothetical protein
MKCLSDHKAMLSGMASFPIPNHKVPVQMIASIHLKSICNGMEQNRRRKYSNFLVIGNSAGRRCFLGPASDQIPFDKKAS